MQLDYSLLEEETIIDNKYSIINCSKTSSQDFDTYIVNDSDSDDCESVVSDTELKDIYGSEEPQAKRQRSLSKSMMTHQKKRGVFIIPVFRKTERKKTPLVTLRTFNPGGSQRGGPINLKKRQETLQNFPVL